MKIFTKPFNANQGIEWFLKPHAEYGDEKKMPAPIHGLFSLKVHKSFHYDKDF